MSRPSQEGVTTMHRLRMIILIGLAASITVFTAATFFLVQGIFSKFGPGMESDLNWKVVRGAKDLARATDLGIAVGDASEIQQRFAIYHSSMDMAGLVAVDSRMNVITSWGTMPEPAANLFRDRPGIVRATQGHLVAWSPAVIEGSEVGKVAVVVTTRRLQELEVMLDRISIGTAIAGLIAMVLGTLFVNHFTREVSQRDTQLEDHARTLERKVDERTRAIDDMNRGMKLVLDNVRQGFVTVDLDGKMGPQRSETFNRWFDAASTGVQLSECMRKVDPVQAELFELGLDQIREGTLPLFLLLDQLPSRLVSEAGAYEFKYCPIVVGAVVQQILVVVSDLTDHLERERMEAEQRELLVMFKVVSNDHSGFVEFFVDGSEIVRTLDSSALDRATERRLLHTLKGNCGIFGLASVAGVCGDLEARDRNLDDADRARLRIVWEQASAKIRVLIGDGRRNTIEIDHDEYRHALAMAENGARASVLAGILASWSLEPVQGRFARLGAHAQALSSRLGKGPVDVRINAHGVRLDPLVWRPFFSAFVHAIRNAVDHGIEDPAVREAAGKKPSGIIELSAEKTKEGLRLALRDDGRGVDWDAIERKAAALGLPHENTKDLSEAIFWDGLSTREEISAVSGRGIGMSALRHAAVMLGGSVEVRSDPGRGTSLEFLFPERPSAPS